MRSRKFVKILIFIILIFMCQSLFAEFKEIRIGRLHLPYLAHGPSLIGRTRNTGNCDYFNFSGRILRTRMWSIFVEDFTDTTGEYHDNYYVCSERVERGDVMPIPDATGFSIFKYRKYPPREVIVDDIQLTEFYPLNEADRVDPDYIPGNADILIESKINTKVGATLHQRVLAWAHSPYNTFHISEWTIKNTGNADLDEEFEFPTDTLKNIYWLQMHGWYGWLWGWGCTPNWGYYGAKPEDSLRVLYAYDCNSVRNDFDDLGGPHADLGFIRRPIWIGNTFCHIDSSYQNHSDDPTQPRMTACWGDDYVQGEENAFSNLEVAKNGFINLLGFPRVEGSYPNTSHQIMFEDMFDYFDKDYPSNFPGFDFPCQAIWSIGPYTIPPGDSIQFIYAIGVGNIDLRHGWDVGQAWLRGECEWDGDYKIPRQIERMYSAGLVDENDLCKDSWYTTGKDSLFKYSKAADWIVEHNYQVPLPPPPPSLTVTSQPNKIVITWGEEAESAEDLVGYRIYRARGDYYYNEYSGEPVGDWLVIDSVPAGTFRYEDTEAERGVAYYYYVTAYDDGSHPEVPDAGPWVGVSLESGKFENMTLKAAHLTRPPGEDLSDIRVVPNPYNASAERLQYPGEARKIIFTELPPICNIYIYNERGDLMRKIEHTDGSGDEAWSDETGEHFMTTESHQVPESGIYIAHIETPDGRSTDVKFLIIR